MDGDTDRDEPGLDAQLEVSRSLLARARSLDALWSQHGPELLGFRCALAERFETVERAVEDLVRSRAAARPTLRSPETSTDAMNVADRPPRGIADAAQNHRNDSRSASWPKQ